MKEKIFVFRIAKGNESGSPRGHCPLDYSQIKKEISDLKDSDIKKIDYNDKYYIKYLYDELWNKHTLRQGWGIKDLDLNQEIPSWIKNYMLNGKIFWNADIECGTAKGRWNIISRMLHMEKNDYIIIPKTSDNADMINDYNHFVVCQIDKNYYYDYNEDIKDFGHCVKVKNIQIFKYNKDTLLRNDFSAPYLWAITEVKEHHSRFNKIKNFIVNNYENESSQDTLLSLCDKFHNIVSFENKTQQQPFVPQTTRLIVMRQDKVRVEIRKENVSHNEPHLHITHSDKIDVSISLKDFSILAGNIDRKYKNKFFKILQPHKEKLNEIWNELNEKENSIGAEKIITDLGL